MLPVGLPEMRKRAVGFHWHQGTHQLASSSLSVSSFTSGTMRARACSTLQTVFECIVRLAPCTDAGAEAYCNHGKCAVRLFSAHTHKAPTSLHSGHGSSRHGTSTGEPDATWKVTVLRAYPQMMLVFPERTSSCAPASALPD